MTAKELSRSADFFVKAVIVFTTIVALLFFAQVYNAIVFSVIAIATLIALIIKGIADFTISRSK